VGGDARVPNRSETQVSVSKTHFQLYIGPACSASVRQEVIGMKPLRILVVEDEFIWA
jgi:hypothetical protein